MVCLLNESTEECVARARELMTQIGIPVNPPTQALHGVESASQDYILANDIIPLCENGPPSERGHSLRVAEYGVALSKFLNFDRDATILQFIINIAHDRGKLKFADCYKDASANEQVRNRMKFGHVMLSNLPREYGKMVSSAIERHHTHQRVYSNPYPLNTQTQQTPENIVLSQLCAIPDLWDSLNTRPSRDTSQIVTREEAIRGVLSEYGEMRIKYKGDLLPHLDFVGREILPALINSH